MHHLPTLICSLLLIGCGTAPPAPADPTPASTPAPPAAPAAGAGPRELPPTASTPRRDVAAQPDWMPAEPRTLDPTVAQARDAITAGQPAQAIALLDTRIAATSAAGATPDADAWYWRGRARLAAEDKVGAEADLRQAVDLAPTWFAARQQLADLLVSTYRCDEAVPHLLQQVQAYPDLAPAWTNLGFCRMRGDEPLLGLADLRKGCSLGEQRACEMVSRAEARGAPAATP